jgi:uncharacterized membrane protein
MPFSALLLVITAAFLHAFWNFTAKKTGGTTVFAFCTGLATVAIWLPIIISYVFIFNKFPEWGLQQYLNIILSGTIHAIYYVILLKGYKSAPLSVVYPVARGTGPLISSFLALWIFNESCTTNSVAGIALIIVGIFTLSWSGQSITKLDLTFIKGILWGIATGISISAYTLVDAYGVKTLNIDPVLFDFSTGLVRTIVLFPFVFQRSIEIKKTFKEHTYPIIIISIFGSLAYILILSAILLAPVSHVAPAREISMLFGAFLGGKVLKEGHLRKRLFAAGLIAVGVILLTLS